MKKLIAWAIAPFNFVLNQLPLKQLVTAVLVGMLLLNSGVNLGTERRDYNESYSSRPETTRQWEKEGRQTEDAPAERLKNIAGESAEAVKEFGSMYKDTAKRTVDAFKNDTAKSN
jgi:hypothetical protein